MQLMLPPQLCNWPGATPNDIRWPIAFDPDGRAALGFGTTGQPETYVISPTGVAACWSLGPVSNAELEAWLRIVRSGGVCA